MPAVPDRPRLEPLPAPVVAVVLAHVLLGMLVWIFLPLWTGNPKREVPKADLAWLPTARFTAEAPGPLPSPPAPKPPPVAPPAPQASSAPLRAPNKYITLSPRLPEVEGPPSPPKPYRPVPTLLDIATASKSARDLGGAEMEAVNDVIQNTYLKEWQAPSTHLVPPGQRAAVVNLSIQRDGTILEASMVKTGAPALNVSISQLLTRVTKIPVTLPSSFRKERYDLQVNFMIE